MKKGLKALIITLAIIVTLIIGGVIVVAASNSAKFLVSVVRFAAETLTDTNFIIYNVDIMEVFRDYADGDIEFEGDVIAGDIEGFNYTSSAKVHGVRSFDMKELSCTADAKVLFINVGEVDLYARDKTMYMIVPSFDNLAYSLTTNTDLFWKAPQVNGNLDIEWFTQNAGNFIEFANDIIIEKTDNRIEDEDGTVSYEYLITIPQGKGDFIWELLGMDIPDHDINLSMYLTRGCKMRRVVIDIGNIVENTVLTVDGTSMGTVILESSLPDNEKLTILLTKRGDYSYASYIDMGMVYNTKNGVDYSGAGVMAYERTDNGYDLQIKRLKLYKGESLIGQMYFDGNVHTTKIDTPPTSSATVPLESIKNYEWEELRDNFESVKNDIMEDVKEKL